MLDLSELGQAQPDAEQDFTDPAALRAALAALPDQELRKRLDRPAPLQDHFAGKPVVRHESGNCAAVVCGPLVEELHPALYASLGYASACTATRTILAVGGGDWVAQARDFLAELVVGDPLDPRTQVGYIEPRVLDNLQERVRSNRLRIATFGGERLSPIQAAPLLVASQADVPDLFGQEIPAYLLGLRQCESLAEAVDRINADTGPQPRLAVSFFNAPEDELPGALLAVRAHAVLVNQPTSTLLPAFHEGNDYLRLLTQEKLVVS
jgi:hypothetical protein